MNPTVKLVDVQLLSHKKFLLRNVVYDIQYPHQPWQRQVREVYDHGNAATVLLYNKQQQTVLFVRQFRIPVYMQEGDGMLMEPCAGLLEGKPAPEVIIREIEEETGYRVSDVQQVYAGYTSAGSLSEKLYFFIAEYSDEQKVSAGGGLAHEQEHLEVVEMPFARAVDMLRQGAILDVKAMVLLQYALLHNIFDEATSPRKPIPAHEP